MTPPWRPASAPSTSLPSSKRSPWAATVPPALLRLLLPLPLLPPPRPRPLFPRLRGLVVKREMSVATAQQRRALACF